MECALAFVVEGNEAIPFEDCVAGLPIACLVQVDRYREPVYVRAVIRHVLPGVKILKVHLHCVILPRYDIYMKVSNLTKFNSFRSFLWTMDPTFLLNIHYVATFPRILQEFQVLLSECI